MLNNPIVGVKFALSDNKIFLQEDDKSKLTGQVQARELLALAVDGKTVELEGSDFLEEPDLLSGYDEYNRFLLRQSMLFELLQHPEIELRLNDQSIITRQIRKAELTDLPVMFWIQLLVASISLIVGTAVWLFRQQDQAALHYFYIGLFLAFVIFPAAIYSSREIALDGELFRLLSVIDHFGLYMVMAAVISLIWCFPCPLWSNSFPSFFYGIMFLCWVADVWQWFPDLDVSTRVIPVLVLLLGIFLLLVHWQRSAGNAVYRQSIKWFLLVVVVGCGLFISVVFVPPLLGFSPPVSQGLAFVAFLSIYLSLALGVERYQLFELDRWWFQFLIWVLVGVILIGFDILFISLLNLSSTSSLWLALAITGWIYFPLRQKLMTLLLPVNSGSLESYLPMVVRYISQARDRNELMLGSRECLINIFSPLTTVNQPMVDNSVSIHENGLSLHVPVARSNQTLVLKCPGQGRNLFQFRDVEIAQALMNLFEQAFSAREARDEAIIQERERIKLDVHDTLGGRLLSIMRQNSEPESALIATSAWRELRDILTALEGKKAPLMHILDQWHKDARQQTGKDEVRLEWIIQDSLRDKELVLDGHQRLNLGQILRESITNALRHSDTNLIEVSFVWNNNQLLLMVTNNCAVTKPSDWVAGRGLHHIRERTQRLAADVRWEPFGDGSVKLIVAVPFREKNNG